MAAEPYETVAFKVPNLEIDFENGKYFEAWDRDQRKYSLQLFFRTAAASANLLAIEQ